MAGSLLLKSPVTVADIKPGTLPAGGALQVIAQRPDGVVEPLLWVQAFNPSYNQPYWFKAPLTFPAGTRIQVAPSSGAVSLLTRNDSGKR